MTKLIPFEREKYEAGAKVVRRDGKEVLQLFFNVEPVNRYEWILQVFRVKPGILDTCINDINGIFYEDKNSQDDLFLEVKTNDFYIGLMKNGLTSQAFKTREDVKHGWDAIVKVSLYPETFEQV